ncbi:MAG: 5-oxoprolinase subunit PxpA [Fuerstiella sp.]
MTKSIDINCDVGEVSFENDCALLPFVSSCNVSCGAHAGDPVLITSTIREAVRLGVAVGAHPSYPDAANFGRLSMQMPLNELSDHLRFQISTVKAITESFGAKLQHVKPHGALYHDVISRPDIAEVLLDVVSEIDPVLSVMGQANSEWAAYCDGRKQPFIHEAFADRRYANQTSLAPRRTRGSVIECETDFDQQVRGLLSGRVVDTAGSTYSLTVQSICLHGDSQHAVPFANRLQQLCDQAGVTMLAMSETSPREAL